MFKKVSAIMISLMVLCLSACNENKAPVSRYKLPDSLNVSESMEIDSNNKYSLNWNKEQNCVFLKNTENGIIWSTTPKAVWENGGSASISSAISIEYYNSTTGVLEEAKSSECTDGETYSVNIKDNILRQEFYFDSVGIMIPIEYKLTENGLRAELKAKEITEKNDVKLIKISFLPYMCSVINSDSEDDYLVAPIGSGALVYPKEDKQDISRKLDLPFYGGDRVQKNVKYLNEDVTVNLPIFAAKAGDNGLLSVINSGAEAATLHIEAGNNRTGHSAIYPIFTVRGYDVDEVELVKYQDDNIYNNNIAENLKISVDYIPLAEEDATYSGMANFYRDNILKINNDNKDYSPYNISVIGGVMTKTFVLGVPTYKFSSLTTFEQSKEIVEELIKETGSAPQVDLEGFGSSGTDIGEIAGGYKYSSSLGGNKGGKAFKEWGEENGIDLFYNFRMMSFSGGGLLSGNKVAKTASLQYSNNSPSYKNAPIADQTKQKQRYLRRDKLDGEIDKLINFTEKNASGISFVDLGNTVYSDYRSTEYYVGGNIETQVSGLLKTVSEAGHKVSLKAANGYAAIFADSITDVPLYNGEYNVLDRSIPLYQTIFRGAINLYGTAQNLASDEKEILLKAVEYGTYPSFKVFSEYKDELVDSTSKELYGSLYSSVKKRIIDTVSSTKTVYEKIGTAQITNHQRKGELSVTEYSNNVTVLVNHGSEPISDYGITVGAKDFAVIE